MSIGELFKEEFYKERLKVLIVKHLTHIEITGHITATVGLYIIKGHDPHGAATRAAAMFAQTLREVADAYEIRISNRLADVSKSKEKP